MRRRRRRIVVSALGVLAVTLAVALASRRTATPPEFRAVREGYCASDVRILDRHGRVIHEQRVDLTRRRLGWTPLVDISPALIDAVLSSEDRRFAVHGGVDWRAILAALWQRARGGPSRGASTVTMQLAALLDPALHRGNAPRSGGDKWRQMQSAWALERRWTKAEILEAYLNLVSFRGELQGLGAAAELLFGKAPHGLTRAESVVLAALLRAPNASREAVLKRSRLLAGAAASGTHTLSDTEAALQDPSLPDETSGALISAIDRALAGIASSDRRIALAPHAARRLLPGIGPSPCADTSSTLDRDVQRYAAESLRLHLLALAGRGARDGAVLVADNRSGDVLAYVGASGDLSPARHVDGVQARRQAGSTLKPFLYALALDRRLLTAASLLDDSPLELAADGGLFRPRDYDEQFRGLVSMRTALAASLNLPAVRTVMLIGPDAFAEQLRAFGLTLPRPGEHYGPALALGAADVTLWELVAAYRALAGGGEWTPLRLSADGAAPAPRRAAGRAAAFVVSDILADRDGRSLTFGLESPLATRFWTAVKTGTSKDMRDNWCIGYSRRYTVGVWVGNFSGEPMRDVSGIAGAAPVWADVMSWLHRNVPSAPPAPPPELDALPVSFATAVEPARREWFLRGTAPSRGAIAPARAPRIVAPVDGAIIALDPDIPSERQRVPFAAEWTPPGTRWLLDGTEVGGATDGILLWPPHRGTHTLELAGAGAHRLGRIAFQVR